MTDRIHLDIEATPEAMEEIRAWLDATGIAEQCKQPTREPTCESTATLNMIRNNGEDYAFKRPATAFADRVFLVVIAVGIVAAIAFIVAFPALTLMLFIGVGLVGLFVSLCGFALRVLL